MPNDPEALRARLAKAREAKAAKAAAEPEPEPEDDDEDVLGQLAATILKARDKKVKQSKILEELGTILDRIDPTEHPELADDPTIQAFIERVGDTRLKKATAKGLRPGTVIGTGLGQQDVPWKESDLTHPVWGCVNDKGEPEYVTFTPNETIPVWYNGIRCQFIADEEITVLKCFKDVYDEHKRATREGEQRKAWMFGKSNIRPAEGGEAAISMASVRAFMSMGGEGGGGRIILGYPGDSRFELREVPGGAAAVGEQSGEATTSQ